jgi:hypothetical protein
LQGRVTLDGLWIIVTNIGPAQYRPRTRQIITAQLSDVEKLGLTEKVQWP